MDRGWRVEKSTLASSMARLTRGATANIAGGMTGQRSPLQHRRKQSWHPEGQQSPGAASRSDASHGASAGAPPQQGSSVGGSPGKTTAPTGTDATRSVKMLRRAQSRGIASDTGFPYPCWIEDAVGNMPHRLPGVPTDDWNIGQRRDTA